MKNSIFNKKIDIDNKSYIYNFFTNNLCSLDKITNNIEQWHKALTKEERKILVKSGFLVKSNYKELKKIKKEYNAAQNDGSLIITFALTLNCNFACPYCYEKREKGAVSKEKQKAFLCFLEQKFKTGKITSLTLTWFGGEPLLYLDIINNLNSEVVALCQKYKIKYLSFLTTNGYIINKENIQKIKDLKTSTIYISLDGSKKHHDSTRKLVAGGGTFDQIIQNLKLLKLYKINFTLRINITKHNSVDLEELLNELHNITSNIYLGHIQNFNDEYNNNENCLSKFEFAKINLRFNKIRNLRGCVFLVKKIHCRAAKTNNFVLDPSLNIYQCENDLGRKERSVGKIFENGNYYKNKNSYLKWNPLKYDKCKKCELLPLCYGGCLFSGLKQKEPQCIMEKYIIDELLESHIKELLNEESG